MSLGMSNPSFFHFSDIRDIRRQKNRTLRVVLVLVLLCLPGFARGENDSSDNASNEESSKKEKEDKSSNEEKKDKADEKKEEEKPQSIGNFSVPNITQIAPLIGFGQLLVGKKALLSQFGEIYTRGHNSYSNVMLPSSIYGIRDDLSIVLFVPFTPRSRSGSSHSSGIMDLFLQGEYGYYMKSYSDHTLTGTLVGNVQFPTGSDSKQPRTGNGSFAYFLGTTLAYLSYDWYIFASSGANLTTSHHRTKFGNSYLYQWGFARYIPQLSPKGWIFDLMVEFDGIYTEKDRIRGKIDFNSGGNILFVTPSIWLSSKRFIVQWGIGFPVVQNLNGSQDKIKYSAAYILAIAFQF